MTPMKYWYNLHNGLVQIMKLIKKHKYPRAKGITFNDQMIVTFNGQSITIYQRHNNEKIAEFTGLKYCYRGQLSPDGEILAVVSNMNKVLFYSMKSMNLIKSFHQKGYPDSQDDGFCFSYDGLYFYHLIMTNHWVTHMIQYEIKTMQVKRVLFTDVNYHLKDIYYVDSKRMYFIEGLEPNHYFTDQSDKRVLKNMHFYAWFDGHEIREKFTLDGDFCDVHYVNQLNLLIASTYHGEIQLIALNSPDVRNYKISLDIKNTTRNLLDVIPQKLLDQLSENDRSKFIQQFSKPFEITSETAHSFFVSRNGNLLVIGKDSGVEFVNIKTLQMIHKLETKNNVSDVIELSENHMCVITWASCESYEIVW